MEKPGRHFPTRLQRRKPKPILSFSELEPLLGKSAGVVTGKNGGAERPQLGQPEGSLGCLQDYGVEAREAHEKTDRGYKVQQLPLGFSDRSTARL